MTSTDETNKKIFNEQAQEKSIQLLSLCRDVKNDLEKLKEKGWWMLPLEEKLLARLNELL